MVRSFVALVLAGGVSLAAYGDESWSGIVKQEPQGDNVHWLIGDSDLTMDEDTKIKVAVGRLEIGACAKVDVAGQSIEKVATRSMSHCDQTDYEAYFEIFRALGQAQGGS